MKHTLKSLLITSVLTLPSVFGLGSESLIVDGDSAAAAEPVTTAGALVPHSASNFNILHKDILDIIIGFVRFVGQGDNNGEIVYGYAPVTVADLKKLAKTNKAFAAHAQPVLRELRQFVVIRSLPSTGPRPLLTPPQEEMVRFLGYNPTRYWEETGLVNDSKELFLRVAENLNSRDFKPEAALIYEKILNIPGAGLSEIFETAGYLVNLGGSQYIAKAAKLYESIASYSACTSRELISAAGELAKIKYYEDAARLYKTIETYLSENVDCGKRASELRFAADELAKIGYYEDAATFYEKAADNKQHVEVAAARLKNLGSAYYGRAATLYEKIVNSWLNQPSLVKNPLRKLRNVIDKISELGFKSKAKELEDQVKTTLRFLGLGDVIDLFECSIQKSQNTR